MAQKPYVLGVDGGGTKTLGAVMDAEGRVLARESFPSSNPHSNPTETVRDVLQTLVQSLCERAGISPLDLDGICMGMAGCDSETERQHLVSLVRPVLSERTKVVVENDAVVAMVAVLGRLHGMLVISGTGSICLGYHEGKKQLQRCGGWGHILDDEGSGYSLGLEGLKAILREVDGRGKKTALTPRIMGHLQFRDPRDIITWTYRGEGKQKPAIAALSPLVIEESNNGDEVASAILDQQAAALAQFLGPVYQRLFGENGESCRLGLWGGNLIHAESYRRRFIAEVEKTGLPIEAVLQKDAEAVLGAAIHAKNLLAV